MMYNKGFDNTTVTQCMEAVVDVVKTVCNDPISGIYHYTSTEVLDSLLSNATFWATNLYYLNDSSEYQTGINFLKNLLSEKFKDEEQEDIRKFCLECIEDIEELDGYTWLGIFSISFSVKEDVLSQWLTYAKEGGVCIKFDKEIMEGNLKTEDDYLLITEESKNNIYTLPSGKIAKTIYSNNPVEGEERVKEIIDRLKSLGEVFSIKADEKLTESNMNKRNIVNAFFTMLASYIKNKDFVMEDEIRMLCPYISSQDGTGADIFYSKRDNGILRPYIKIIFRKGSDLFDAKPMLPITSIIVGPAGNQEAVFSSVVHRVEYGETAIWTYDKEHLEMFLADYTKECLNSVILKRDYSAVELKAEVTKSVNYILNDWLIRYGKEYIMSCEVEIKEEKLCPIIKLIAVDSEKDTCEVKEKIPLEREMKEKIEEWKKDNFLSKQGVWIKKSQIPYVY